MKIGACYIRVSTADQTEFSPESQLRMIREYAAKNQILIPETHVYRDDGISGRTVEKRPAFQKMILAAKQKSFELILVYSTSRFARNHEQSIVYRSMLEKEYGVEVVSITQPNIDKKTDMLTTAIYSIMDEWYSMDLSDNVRRGMTEKALKGGHQTVAPLGYERKHKGATLTIKEDEAETVRTIFRLYMSGKSTWKIARELNTIGTVTKSNRPLSERFVMYILRNPVYKGYSRWTPTCKIGNNFKHEDSIIVKSQHEPIIDETTFDEVQKTIDMQEAARTKKARPAETMRHWLSGMVKCSVCGGSLVYVSANTEARNPYFRCGAYARGTCKTQNYIIVSRLEKDVLNCLRAFLKGTSINYSISIEKFDKTAEQLKQLNAELSKVNSKVKKAKEAYLSSVFTLKEFKEIKLNADKKIKDIKARIEKLENKTVDYDILKESITSACDILECSTVSLEEKQASLRSVLTKIVYDKKGGNLHFYFYI